MASLRSGIVMYFPSVFEIPVTMSAMMSIGSSFRGLSDVMMVKSDSLPETSPISKRRTFDRFPPQPNSVTSRCG